MPRKRKKVKVVKSHPLFGSVPEKPKIVKTINDGIVALRNAKPGDKVLLQFEQKKYWIIKTEGGGTRLEPMKEKK